MCVRQRYWAYVSSGVSKLLKAFCSWQPTCITQLFSASLLSLCFKWFFMDFVVSGCTVYARVLPLNEELIFKYHKGSLVCLPLRCETEFKLLKIGIGNVELEYKTSLRLSDVLCKPVLVHLGQLFLCYLHRQRSSANAMVVMPFCLQTGIPCFCWELSVVDPFLRRPVGSNITGNFFFLHCKGKKLHFFFSWWPCCSFGDKSKIVSIWAAVCFNGITWLFRYWSSRGSVLLHGRLPEGV